MGSSQFAGCCKLPHRAIGAGFSKETDLGCAASAANQMKSVVVIFIGCGTPIGRCIAPSNWKQMHREGLPIARCTVQRLMRRLGLEGARRVKKVRTTNPDITRPCPLDLVKRQFTAQRPNQLLVAEFTYVSTWQGQMFVAFVIDVYTRRIVGCPTQILRSACGQQEPDHRL